LGSRCRQHSHSTRSSSPSNQTRQGQGTSTAECRLQAGARTACTPMLSHLAGRFDGALRRHVRMSPSVALLVGTIPHAPAIAIKRPPSCREEPKTVVACLSSYVTHSGRLLNAAAAPPSGGLAPGPAGLLLGSTHDLRTCWWRASCSIIGFGGLVVTNVVRRVKQ